MSSFLAGQVVPFFAPHPLYPSPLHTPGGPLPPFQLLSPVPNVTAPAGSNGGFAVFDAAAWAFHSASALVWFYQGGQKQTKYLSARVERRVQMGMTQGGYLALDAAGHVPPLTSPTSSPDDVTAGKDLRKKCLEAIALRVEDMLDVDNATGPLGQLPRSGFSEMGQPCLGLVTAKLIPVLATLNLAAFERILPSPLNPSERAACDEIYRCESQQLLLMAQAIAKAHPGEAIHIVARCEPVLARLLALLPTISVAYPTISIARATEATSWARLRKRLDPLNTIFQTIEQHPLRPGPTMPDAADVHDLRLDIADPRLVPRLPTPNMVSGVIAIDSNMFMERCPAGSTHPVVLLVRAAIADQYLVCVSSQTVVELSVHKDISIRAFANVVHHGQLAGTINMSSFVAPTPSPFPPAVAPAIDPYDLDKDVRIGWELMAMLVCLGIPPAAMTLVTADKGIFGYVKTFGIGGILMARANRAVPRAVRIPDTVAGWTEIIRKLV